MLRKIAATRYEKEIKKGTISRKQLPGGDYEPSLLERAKNLAARRDPSALSRKATRDALYEQTPRTQEALAKTRAFNEAAYESAMNHLPTYHPAVVATQRIPGPGMAYLTVPSKLRDIETPDIINLEGVLPGAKTKRKMIGARRAASGYGGEISMSQPSSMFRRIAGGKENRIGLSDLSEDIKDIIKNKGKGLDTLGDLDPYEALSTALPHSFGTKPIDKSLQRTILQHEVGEAEQMSKKRWVPFATHAGVTPIIREREYLANDPESFKIMSSFRKSHADDAQVQKLLRHVGATPDHPIPAYGKQHKAIENALIKNPSLLAPGTRLKNLLVAQEALKTVVPGTEIPYIPESVSAARDAIAKANMELSNPIKKLDATGKVKNVLKSINEQKGNIKTVFNWIRKGKV